MDRGAWLVRWRDGSGRQRGKRFSSEEAAQAFDSALSESRQAERQADATGRAGGVYPYATAAGHPLALLRSRQRRHPDEQARFQQREGRARRASDA